MTVETGPVEFVELEQLNTYSTYVELGPNKKVAPIFIILDISDDSNAGIREVKLASRPGMEAYYIPGATQIGGAKAVSASRNRYDEYIMIDRIGVFLEDPTRTVIIRELPRV